MTISGKEAEALMEEIRARNARVRAEALARAKAEAAARGKEPFDLDKLETMCDTTSAGRIDPIEERHARLEEMYYVRYPSILTLAEFAREVTELGSASFARCVTASRRTPHLALPFARPGIRTRRA